MPTWDSFSIKAFMRQRFTADNVAVDNDVNVMALGEASAGAGRSGYTINKKLHLI